MAVRLLLVMLLGTVVMSACGNEECDFPTAEERLAPGESQTVEVRVIDGRVGEVQAAGWTYSAFPWAMHGGSDPKRWKSPRVSLADDTYEGVVTALGNGELKLTGVGAERILLSPVGCY